MKNTLWIFGDSFSWDHKIRIKSNCINLETDTVWHYIRDHLNGEIFDSWGEIVSRELDMDYVNHASYQTGIEIKNLPNGNSNNTAVNLLHELASDFKKGDIVILGFTDIVRFEYGNTDDKLIRTHIANDLGNVNTKVIENILLNRDEFDFYKFDILQKLKGLELLSNVVGFDLWYWDWSDCFDIIVREKKVSNDRWIFFKSQHDYYSYLYTINEIHGGGSVYWETDGIVNDHHYGKVGNKIHANILINFLKNRL